jgi:hypothetical protein
MTASEFLNPQQADGFSAPTPRRFRLTKPNRLVAASEKGRFVSVGSGALVAR